jgi:hypothetical protein
VKLFANLAVLLTTAVATVNAQSWQELSSGLFTNAEIVWRVPTNALPKNLWVYRRMLPHIFSQEVISNAIVLGSLQSRGFPRSTTHYFSMAEQVPENWPGPIPVIFALQPGDAYLSYSIPHNGPISRKEVPSDATIVKTALKSASLLGLDPAKLEHNKIYTHSCDTDQAADVLCGRGVFFPRYLDGIGFFSASDDGESAEGFSMEFGEHGKIQSFWVRWSKLERYKNERTASPDEIIRCLRANKTIVMPNFRDDDLARLKKLATAKKFTITKITPYYGEGMFGEVPTNDVPCEFATPFAELEAVADFGNSNTTVRLLSPILSSEVVRLLANKPR